MVKPSIVAAALAALLVMAHGIGCAAFAQGAPPPDVPSRDLPSNGGAGVRTGNITSTGATVPNPGASQSGGTTSMDLGIQQQDSKIESSICKGC